jgi:DNA polymerase-3 subunit epsilon
VTGWHLGPMTPFDIESGGVDVGNDGVITVTVASLGGHGFRTKEAWSGLIAVDFDIDPEATRVHGITTEYARANGKPAADVLDEAAERLAASLGGGVPVVGMNMPFDFTILDRNCRRYGVPTLNDRLNGQPIAPVIDVLTIDRHLDRYRPGGRKLVDLCSHYGVRHDGAHDATEDAWAAARIAYVIGSRSHLPREELFDLYMHRRYPDRLVREWRAFARLTLPELHAAQVDWYAESTKSLGEYWAKQRLQRLAEADQPVPPPLPELPDASDDERRQVLREQADELAERIAGLRFSWPIEVAP